MERVKQADWAAPGDAELFAEAIGEPPAPGDAEGLRDWTRKGLEEFDPRPIYLDLVTPVS